MASSPNLFLRLHKWATRQEENYLTESLAVLLEVLIERECAVGARLLKALTGGFIDIDESTAETLEIQTQVSTAHGKPDMQIRLPDRLAVLEVKCKSGLQAGQLEGYREFLRASEYAQKTLILLTRYPAAIARDAERPDFMVRWYEVADAIERELDQATITDPVCLFFCQQFHDFLKEQNMAIAQVGWQMSEGAKALRNFLAMLLEASKACHVQANKSLSLEYVGFALDGGKYWVGVYLNEPQKLWFSTSCKLDLEAASRLQGGELTTASWVPGGYRWSKAFDLESEGVHFYHRSKVGQIQWLENSLRECLELARRIETVDQPPTLPVQPEE